jgi:cyclic 2,3-diphosphoglycerate synthetase
VRELGAAQVLDLSDEPVVDGRRRFALAAAALAAGAGYTAGGLSLRAPPRAPYPHPSLAVAGTGKRVGKTAVAGHLARLAAGRLGVEGVVVVAMGRGGPREPELVDPVREPLGLPELLRRSREGAHAASDFLEDAALKGVVTIGCRRCGGGPAGDVAYGNVAEGAALAAARAPALTIFEGSGAALPPVAADATVLVTSGATPVEELAGYLGPYRLRIADLVLLLAEGAEAEARRAAITAVRPDLPVLEARLEPRPLGPVDGRRVGLFTTAPPAGVRAIADGVAAQGAEVVVASGALAEREALARDVGRALDAGADVLLVELKAAAVDVVAEAGSARGVEVLLLDHALVAAGGARGLDEALLQLVDRVAASGAPDGGPPAR